MLGVVRLGTGPGLLPVLRDDVKATEVSRAGVKDLIDVVNGARASNSGLATRTGCCQRFS